MVAILLADSHCHLDQLSGPAEAVKRAGKEGVHAILTCATGPDSLEKTLSLGKIRGVKIALGIHPSEALRMGGAEIEKAFKFVESNVSKCAAIGEVGLDFKHAKTDKERAVQESVFSRFISLARKHDKPVCVHARYAETRCLDILEREMAKKVHLHWFTNSAKTAARAVSLGYFISCGPIILHDEASATVVGKIPLASLLLETDAPVPFGGASSEPSWIPRVRGKVAELKGVSVAEAESSTWANFTRLFGH